MENIQLTVTSQADISRLDFDPEVVRDDFARGRAIFLRADKGNATRSHWIVWSQRGRLSLIVSADGHIVAAAAAPEWLNDEQHAILRSFDNAPREADLGTWGDEIAQTLADRRASVRLFVRYGDARNVVRKLIYVPAGHWNHGSAADLLSSAEVEETLRSRDGRREARIYQILVRASSRRGADQSVALYSRIDLQGFTLEHHESVSAG